MLAAPRRASSRVSSLVADPARLILKIDLGQRLPVVILHDEAGAILLDRSPGRREVAGHGCEP